MKCPICEKGRTTRKRVPVDRLGIFVGEFGANVCGKCGKQIFDCKEAESIEAETKKLGLWGAEESKVYKLGGNLAISIRKKIVDLLGITKDSKVMLVPYARERRIIVEIS